MDFSYADKRPLYILEQEMTILHQNKLTIDEFYDEVNEKLNNIIIKINMTYKDKTTTKPFIESANQKALRTFITGLNNRRGEILYASNPSSLPEAYAKLQTITNDQERIFFAKRFTNNQPTGTIRKNPQFRYKDNINKIPDPEPMEIDRSSTFVNVPIQPQTNRQEKTNFKRDLSFNNASRQTTMPNQKIQRINNLQNEGNYAKTIYNDEELTNEEINEISDSESISSHVSNVFLDK